jgi:Transposase and inactivated derivatives
MANTFTQLNVQIVFAVQGRKNFVKESFREELQKYMTGIVTRNKQKLLAIYCMPDHTHLFVRMEPDLAISDLVRDIKAGSSSFIKDKGWCKPFAWQRGFGAFSYSKSQTNRVVNYILNQPEHHRKRTFREEYVKFLEAFEIEYDQKYLFEFYD